MRRSFVSLILVVFLSSCGLTDSPTPPLALSITAEPSTLIDPALGGRVVFRAVNISGRMLEIKTTGGCLLGIDVTGPDGEPVTQGIGCALVHHLVTIAPDEVLTVPFRIGRYREKHRPGPKPFVPWKAGTYTARGFVLLPGTFETEPLEFTLVCRQKLGMKC